MHFTDYEIELAHMLKESGVLCGFSLGDTVLFPNKDKMLVGIIVGDLNRALSNDIEVAILNCRFIVKADKVLWLPSFRQLRAILMGQDVTLTITEKLDDVLLTAWIWKDSDQAGRYLSYLTQIIASTDLEAMYQLLLFVKQGE